MTKIKTKFKQTETRLIPNGWEEIIFSEAVEINPKRDLKKGTITKAVAMEDIQPFTKKIHNYTLKKFKGGSKFKNNDTLFARITPSLENGKTAFVDILSCNEIGFGSTEFIVLSAKKEKAVPNYVYYLSRSPEVRNIAIKSMTGTSGRQRVENNIFDTIVVLLPKIKEQKKIGKTLYDLDTKIENLQQQNKILEQIAQAIFKSWFVDFDGQTEFADSELGKIPKGWTVRDLGDICEIIMGQSPPSISYNENGDGIIFFQGITDFGNFFPTPRIYCTSPKKFAEKNDILFTVRAPISAINIAKERCSIGRGLTSLRLKENHGSFLYYLLKNSFQEWQKFESQGTVYGSVTRDDIYNFKITIPLTKIIILFNQIIDPLYYYIWNNNEQMQSLTKTRDAILPKLMSGEIRI